MQNQKRRKEVYTVNIHEAIMARTHEKPYITRRDWGYITVNPVNAPVKGGENT